jgi:putative transposase
MPDHKWARLLAYVTGLVNQKLLLQNEYLAAENRILRAHLPARMRLSDPERSTLAEIGKRLGRAALQQVACVAKPDAILAWYWRLIARKFDGSTVRTSPGRPRIAPEMEALIVRFARENSGWGYDRIVGALANLGPPGFRSDCGKHPPPIRDPAGTQAKPEYNLEGFHRLPHGCPGRNRLLHSRSAHLARPCHLLRLVLHSSGIAPRQSRRFDQTSHRRVDDSDGSQRHRRGFRIPPRHALLLHDRDTKFCAAFLDVLRSSGLRPLALPPRSPNLNAFSERWVCSIRQECLSKLILFGEASLRRALNEYIDHHHFERNHQGKGNLLLFPSPDLPPKGCLIYTSPIPRDYAESRMPS